jgi:two-component system sensor histidine kinase KdpD
LGYALAVAAVALGSLAIVVLGQVWQGGVSLAMAYLPAVLGVAALAGRGPAVVASVLAFLAFDFLFVDPRHTFTISDPGEWLSLLLFLLTALVTGQLAAMLRRQAQAAEQQAREMTTLYDLSQALTVAVGLEPTLTAITDRVVAVFSVRSCAALLPGPDGALTVAAATGDLRPADVSGRDVQAIAQRVLADGQPIGLGARAVRWQVGGQPPPGRRALYVPLRAGGQTVGVLRVGARADSIAFSAAEERTLATFAAQAALAITRARLAEEATRAEIARRGDELKSALLSSVSHDLRTPLASIKTAVTSLLQPGVEWREADRREFLTAIDEEADRLNRLVANLLDLSRIEAGTLRPDADWNALDEVIVRVVRRLAPRLADHPVALALPDETPLARFDEVHLEQVLTNLLENAAKYSPAGAPIEVGLRVGAATLEATVADHGPGIPAWERERVFDRFYRLRRDGQRATGAGLGLAIVRGLVEANGGRVWVEEAPGGGAAFRLALPLADGAPARALPDAGAGR